MMYNYPFWGFPSFRRNYYYQRPNYYSSNYYRVNNNVRNSSNNSKNYNNNSNVDYSNTSTKTVSNTHSNDSKKNVSNDSLNNTKKESTFPSYFQNESRKVDFSCDENFYSDTELFNIFGFSLHIDDLLILALLFFLYQEGTDDIYLYIALFLLLLS